MLHMIDFISIRCLSVQPVSNFCTEVNTGLNLPLFAMLTGGVFLGKHHPSNHYHMCAAPKTIYTRIETHLYPKRPIPFE